MAAQQQIQITASEPQGYAFVRFSPGSTNNMGTADYWDFTAKVGPFWIPFDPVKCVRPMARPHFADPTHPCHNLQFADVGRVPECWLVTFPLDTQGKPLTAYETAISIGPPWISGGLKDNLPGR
jgi:hypothetical protein